jgi:TPR repeat protein
VRIPREIVMASRFGFALLALAVSILPAHAGSQEEFEAAQALRIEGKMIEAHDLYLSAAKQGHVDSQLELGRMHASGLGVPQDFSKAHFWYDIAVQNGSSGAVFGRRNALKRLTEAQIAEATRLATICIESNYESCE